MIKTSKQLDPDYLTYMSNLVKSQSTSEILSKILSPRFEADRLKMTHAISVVDITRRSQFDSNEKYYYIVPIDGKYVLNFSSKFDYLEGLSSSQIDLIESNDVEIEIFKDRVHLSCVVSTVEDLADKIRLLADVLKDFH